MCLAYGSEGWKVRDHGTITEDLLAVSYHGRRLHGEDQSQQTTDWGITRKDLASNNTEGKDRHSCLSSDLHLLL